MIIKGGRQTWRFAASKGVDLTPFSAYLTQFSASHYSDGGSFFQVFRAGFSFYSRIAGDAVSIPTPYAVIGKALPDDRLRLSFGQSPALNGAENHKCGRTPS